MELGDLLIYSDLPYNTTNSRNPRYNGIGWFTIKNS